jgi:hypothetical protein
MADDNNLEEQLTRYRKAALEAEQSANRATDPDIRNAYLGIMRTWIYLAEEVEREIAIFGSDGMIDRPGDGLVPGRAEHETRRSR